VFTDRWKLNFYVASDVGEACRQVGLVRAFAAFCCNNVLK